jgi:hypothetical protein
MALSNFGALTGSAVFSVLRSRSRFCKTQLKQDLGCKTPLKQMPIADQQ